MHAHIFTDNNNVLQRISANTLCPR